MAKLIVSNQLKKGETFTGELETTGKNTATFRNKSGDLVKLPLPDHIVNSIEEEYYAGTILQITNGDSWEIEELADFPSDGKA